VLHAFEGQYLPPMTRDLAKELCSKHEALGWPGMLGSLDCSHWVWAKCPVEHQGEYKKGSKERTTIVYEGACDADLYMWHCHFALPGACNDINVLDMSPLLSTIALGNTMAKFVLGDQVHHQP